MHIKKIKYEAIFDILLVLLIVCCTLSESQFNEMEAFGTLLRVIKFAVIGLIIVFALIKNRKANRDIFITTLLLLVVLVFNLAFSDGGLSIIPIVMLVWASKNYPLENTFRYAFIAEVFTYAFVMVCALLGIVKDDVSLLVRGAEARFFAGVYYRHNMGFLIHNQVAICLFAIYLLYIIIKRENIRWYISVLFMVLNFIVLINFGSRIIFVLIPITCIGYYSVRMIERRHKSKQSITRVAVAAFPVCCIFSFIISYGYSNGSQFYRMLDALLSNRLRMAKDALTHYGIHLIGAGQYAATYSSATLVDNTVDNGYVAFFIQNGLIAGLIVVGIWTYITYLAVKNSNRYLTLTLAMIAVENIINPHLGSYLLIPFLCILVNKKDPLVTSKHSVLGKDVKKAKKHKSLRFRVRQQVEVR